KFGVVELPWAVPVVIPPYGAVQEPVVGNGRLLGVNNRQTVPRRLNRSLRMGEHLQVGCFDHRPLSSSHRSAAPLRQPVNHSQVQVTLRSPPLYAFGNSRTFSSEAQELANVGEPR